MLKPLRSASFYLLLVLLAVATTARAQTEYRPLLRLDVLNSGTLTDQTHVYFQQGATTGFDPSFDATKLTNPSGLNLASLAGGQQYAISGLPLLMPGVAYTVPLYLGVPAYGTYRFRVGEFVNLQTTQVYLRDAVLNTRTALALATTYTFSMTGTYVTSTRFSLEFTEEVLPDLVVTTNLLNPLTAYRNVTIRSGGYLRLQSDLHVTGTLTVEDGGALGTSYSASSSNIVHHILTGNTFTLQPGGFLVIGEEAGITRTGSSGSIQTAVRNFSTDARYSYFFFYNGPSRPVTGNGLPATVRELIPLTRLGNGLPPVSPGTLVLSQPVAITQTLNLGYNLDTDGHALTLKSTPTGGTAIISDINGRVFGDITVERAIDPSLNAGSGYRHFSNPLNSGSTFGLTATNFTPVVNAAYNGSATPSAVTPFPNLFTYDFTAIAGSPATSYSAFDRGWRALGIGDVAPVRGTGFIAHLPASAVVSFTGTLNEVSQAVPLPANPDATAGWVLLGNPFVAPLDGRLITRPASVPAAFYVFETTGAYAGRYRAYVNGLGASPLIPVGQGFFMSQDAGAGAATLTIPTAARVNAYSAATPTLHRPAADLRPQLQLRLSGHGSTDDLYLYAETGATPAFDAAFDARKLPSPGQVELATLAGNELLSIDGRPALAASQLLTVPLHVATPRPGPYTLRAEALLNLTATPVFLLDARTGQRIDLRQQPEYAFSTTATEPATGRFTLQLGAAAPTATAAELLSAAISLYPNPAHASVTVSGLPPTAGSLTLIDALGRTALRRELTAATAGSLILPTTGQAPGVYTLRLATAAAVVTKRVAIE
ncbi:T9SS type A sorting domain-containing protein [Hymenobacter sp. ASUV-10]|uniref:T9SS type A sorting domain-containing protein n=1 Tax=Hymenobacter aranciens TaxID=3063996 RepID=A0ABT9B931_9BACT|nr:T9SS type A sorting domain-containing protein [Hymenobacter sp. ASUV-10]MDO7874667.1 T9SS type A sorting domain-containing protein [Hymenobacter sp. ASUV-10]